MRKCPLCDCPVNMLLVKYKVNLYFKDGAPHYAHCPVVRREQAG